MFLKAIVAIAVLGVCYGAEEKHAYSSQSFVRYDNHKAEHHVPVKVAVPVKAVAPVVTKVVVPVAHYVSQGHGQSQQGQSQQGHSSHHAATSSQHIQRHDVPGKAPADYHEHYGHPKYEFEYKVEDPHTGDNKYQHESRDGDVVKGVYSLHEADGSIRTVEYSANKHTGFIANVKHSTKHIQPKHHH